MLLRHTRVICLSLAALASSLTCGLASAQAPVDPALAAKRAAYSALFKEQTALEEQLKTLPESIQCMALAKAWLDLEPELAKYPTKTPRQKFDLQARVAGALFVIDTYAHEVPNDQCRDLGIAASIVWEEATYKDSYDVRRVKVAAVKAAAELYMMEPHHTFTDYVTALGSHLRKQAEYKAAHPYRTPPAG